MTNAGFHRDKIEKFEGESFCGDFIKPMLWNGDCAGVDCDYCHVLMMLWLQEEHEEPEVDWESVPIDTPILVRGDEEDEWRKRYFAGLSDREGTYAWADGTTSFTGIVRSPWKHAKLWEGSQEQAAEQEAAK